MNLLYPKHIPDNTKTVLPQEGFFEDIRLEQLAEALSSPEYGIKITQEQLYKLFTSEPETLNFRRQIITALTEDDSLINCFEEVYSDLNKYSNLLREERIAENKLRKRIIQLHIIRMFDKITGMCIKYFSTASNKVTYAFSENITDYRNRGEIDETIKKLNKINTDWINRRNVVIGVNITPNITAQTIKMFDYNDRDNSGINIFEYDISEQSGDKSNELYRIGNYKTNINGGNAHSLGTLILHDIKKVNRKSVNALKSAFTYDSEYFSELGGLCEAFAFYLGVISLIKKLKVRGFSLCIPDLAEGRYSFKAKGLYSLELALNPEIAPVLNDIDLDKQFYTVTGGANSSGKTEFLISVVQAQFMAQLGMPVPAGELTIVPVKRIFTLFSKGESKILEDSRMGVEIKNLKEILQNADERSLVLLNEPMTSTSAEEGVQICRDITEELVKRSASGFIVTHYYELYDMLVQTISPQIIGSIMTVTLSGESGEGSKRTYKVIEKKPEFKSFALEMADIHKISFKAFVKSAAQKGLKLKFTGLQEESGRGIY